MSSDAIVNGLIAAVVILGCVALGGMVWASYRQRQAASELRMKRHVEDR